MLYYLSLKTLKPCRKNISINVNTFGNIMIKCIYYSKRFTLDPSNKHTRIKKSGRAIKL